MKICTENGLKEALRSFEEGKLNEAQKIIDNLFEEDLDCKEIIFTNRCCTYWIDSTKRLNAINDRFEQTEYIFSEWKTFQSFISKEKYSYEPAMYSVQKGYFLMALQKLTALFDEQDSMQKADIYKKAGICYKKLGDFENAKNCLSEANNIYPHLASVLAELADCYSLCGEDRYSKVLFREAFYIAPEFIDLDFLDSELIKCLIKGLEEKGYFGRTLSFWIPVYGAINGIFNIRRELSAQEVCKLKQNIYAMEMEFKDPDCNDEILIPKLLNNYFWLVDHYVLTKEKVTKINEILLKIKILDNTIYKLYTK